MSKSRGPGREQLEKRLRQFEVTPPSAPAAEREGSAARYREAAAVLASFEQEAFFRHRRTTARASGSEAVAAAQASFLADCALFASADGRVRWSLRGEVRKPVLADLGRREMLRETLLAQDDRDRNDPLQRVLDAVILGHRPQPEERSPDQWYALVQVAEWLDGVLPPEQLPDVERVRRLIDRFALIEPFRRLVGDHFRGRERELRDLREFVGVLPSERWADLVVRTITDAVGSLLNWKAKRPMVIHALGGTGKSTLLARFILDHAELDDPRRLPYAYLNFDRPELATAEPLVLLSEFVRQLGFEFPEAQSRCDALRRGWDLSARAGVRPRGRGRDESGWETAVTEFRDLAGVLGVEGVPILLVFDTYEEVQYRSRGHERDIDKLMQRLRKIIPRIRVVIAGRSKVTAFPNTDYPLGDLDTEAAVGFLLAHEVPEPEARVIVTQVGGNALTLKLAVAVFHREGVSSRGFRDLKTHDYLVIRVQEERVQGQLYRRILWHIHDEDVAKLAHPGLALRRITPRLIWEVLARPCGVEVRDERRARELFKELGREVSLVERDDRESAAPDEHKPLVHRPDIRRIMLSLMSVTPEDREKVRAVHSAAVDFYRHEEGAAARAEEIYHRLMLGQGRAEVDPRWRDAPGVENFLYNAVEELEPRTRAYLAARLGVEVDDETLGRADPPDWEVLVHARVERLIDQGAHAEALELLRRGDRLPGSPLYRDEALLLAVTGRYEEGIRIAMRGEMSALDAKDSQAAAMIALVRVTLHMHWGDLAGAYQAADRARGCAEDAGLPSLEVVALLYMLRLARPEGAGSTVGDISWLRARLVDLSRGLSEAELQQLTFMGLAGALAEFVGPDDPRILRLALEPLTLDAANGEGLARLAHVLADWDAAASSRTGEPPGMLARHLGGRTEGEELWRTWLGLLDRGDRRSVVAGLKQLLSRFDPPRSVLDGLAALVAECRRLLRPYLPNEDQVKGIATALQRISVSGLEKSLGKLFPVDADESAAPLELACRIFAAAQESGRLQELLRALTALVPDAWQSPEGPTPSGTDQLGELFRASAALASEDWRRRGGTTT
jgi:hypothetical protein